MDYVANKEKTDEIRGLKRPLYVALEPLFTLQYSHYCHTIQPLLCSKTAAVRVVKRLYRIV